MSRFALNALCICLLCSVMLGAAGADVGPRVAIGSVVVQTNMTLVGALYNSSSFVHPPASGTVATVSRMGTVAGSLPSVSYDEQIGTTFTQSFSSLSYNVIAVQQSDAYGYGPAYLLNALTGQDYWYQVGISWDWPYTGGSYSSGFNMAYEVFGPSGASIFPSDGGGLISFTGQVNQGDAIDLSLTFSGGNVIMSAYDWNTGAYASESYSAYGANAFIGNPTSESSSQGYFTGVMTEKWLVGTYFGTMQPTTYTSIPANSGITSEWLWMDEWKPPSGPTVFGTGVEDSFVTNAVQFQTLTSNGAVEKANAYQVVTGNYPLTVQAPTTPNSMIDVTESAALAAGNIINGTAPYTYQWYEKAEGSSSYSEISGANSASYSMITSGGTAPGAYSFEVLVSDTATSFQNNGVQMSPPVNVTVSALPSVSVYPSSNAVSADAGQNFAFNAVVTGGTAPYTYNWILKDAYTNAVVANGMFGNQPAASSFVWAVPNSITSNAVVAKVKVNDSASPQVTSNTATSGIVTVNPTLGASIASAYAGNAFDLGQNAVFHAAITGGTAPYTYNFIISNSVSNAVVFSSGAVSSNVFTFAGSYAGSFRANVAVTDSAAAPELSSSAYSGAFTFAITPMATSLAPNGAALDYGQQVTYNAIVFGGVGPFVSNLVLSNGMAVYTTIGGAGTVTLGPLLPPLGTDTFNLVVTDVGTATPYVFNSASNTIIVSGELQAPSAPAVNATGLDAGQSLGIFASWAGGTPPYVCNFIISDAATHAVVASSGLQTSNSFAYETNTPGSFYANVIVIDSAASPSTSNSPYSIAFSIANALSVPAAPSVARAMLDGGQTQTLTAFEPNGMAPYTYNFVITNSATNAVLLSSGPTASNVFSYSVNQIGSFWANVSVADSANSPMVYNSVRSFPFSVAQAPTAGPIAPSNALLDYGQYVTYTFVMSGGVGPFEANLMANGVVVNSVFTANDGAVSFGAVEPQVGQWAYNASISDLGVSVPYIAYAGGNIIQVSPALSNPVLAVSNATADQGQVETVTVQASGGTAPYGYNFIVINDLNGNVIASATHSGISSASDTFSFEIPTGNDALGWITVEANATDSATTSEHVTATNAIGVSPALEINLSAENGTIYIGQAARFTASVVSGGTGPFSVNLIANGVVVASNTINTMGGSAGMAYVPNAVGSFAPYAMVVDAGSGYSLDSEPVGLNVIAIEVGANATNTMIPANIPMVFDYPGANAVITITSQNSVTANILVANVTGNYSAPSSSTVTVSVLNISIALGANEPIDTSVTISYGCGRTAPTPYKLVNGTWNAITPFTQNSAACTLTFTIPPDPVIGVFASPSATTTSSGGGGGGGGGGGPTGPTVAQTSGGCYVVSNLSQLNQFHVTINSTGETGVVNFITPTTAGITVNSIPAILSLGSETTFAAGTGYAFTVELMNLSYLPIGQTIILNVCPISRPAIATTVTTVTTSTTTSSSSSTSTATSITIEAPATREPVQQGTQTGQQQSSKTRIATLGYDTAIGAAVALAALAIAYAWFRSRGGKEGGKPSGPSQQAPQQQEGGEAAESAQQEEGKGGAGGASGVVLALLM